MRSLLRICVRKEKIKCQEHTDWSIDSVLSWAMTFIWLNDDRDDFWERMRWAFHQLNTKCFVKVSHRKRDRSILISVFIWTIPYCTARLANDWLISSNSQRWRSDWRACALLFFFMTHSSIRIKLLINCWDSWLVVKTIRQREREKKPRSHRLDKIAVCTLMNNQWRPDYCRQQK